jgi:hypothetical protein
MKNPLKEPLVDDLFKVRDVYFGNQNYDNRWQMGEFLMGAYNIPFAQSATSKFNITLHFHTSVAST